MGVKTEVKPDSKPAVKVEQPVKTIDLELVTYQRYHRGGRLYVAEQAYRFTEAQAVILLEEVDSSTSRPVWRRYKPKAAAAVPELGIKKVSDSTTAKVERIPEDEVFAEVPKRIDIGSDAEISDILQQVGQVEDGPGEGVTV
jgi:hypothetical protein